MSIDMYLTPSRQQSDAFSHSIHRQIEDYQLAQKALSHFQDSVDAFKGQAYDSLRLYAQDIIQPLIDGGLLYILSNAFPKPLPKKLALKA